MKNHLRYCAIIFIFSVFAGCAALDPVPYPPDKPPMEPPPIERPDEPLPPSTKPKYNLMGYPPASQEGYIDGCETAKKSKWAFKDLERYESDGQYRTGWDDGFSICNK